jgi:hypothetical protein
LRAVRAGRDDPRAQRARHRRGAVVPLGVALDDVLVAHDLAEICELRQVVLGRARAAREGRIGGGEGALERPGVVGARRRAAQPARRAHADKVADVLHAVGPDEVQCARRGGAHRHLVVGGEVHGEDAWLIDARRRAHGRAVRARRMREVREEREQREGGSHVTRPRPHRARASGLDTRS